MNAQRAISILLLLILPAASPPEGSSAGEEGPSFDESLLYERLEKYEREKYEGLRYLLNDHQKKQYLNLPTREEREEWLVKFWRMNDPVPGTSKNERRIEHEERVALARKRYAKEGFPRLDHRGETLIRFGEPDVVKEVSADLVSAEQQNDFFRLKMPGEVWYYDRLGLIVPFEQVKLDGECIYFMEINTISREMRYFLNRILKVEDVYVSELWSPVNDYLNYDPSNVEQLNYAAIEELNRFYSYIDEDRFFHKNDIEDEPIGFYFDIVCFRGGEGKIRTEVNLEIPTSELSFRERDSRHHSRFELFVSLSDMDMNEVVSASKGSRLSFNELDEVNSSLIPAQFILAVEPGYYRLCLEVRDLYSSGHGCYRTSRYIMPMGDSLGVSDLLFASSMTPAEGNESFVKGTDRVVPHPMHAYRKPSTIKVYYEIYGLGTDAGDFAFYSVEYSIREIGKRRSGPVLKDAGAVISSRHETSAFGSTQREKIEFGTEELRDGIFELSLAVTDRRTRETAVKTARFTVVE